MSTQIHAVIHPIWGNNFSEQLSADTFEAPGGEEGTDYKWIPEPTWWNKDHARREWVKPINRPAADDDSVWRQYRHRCSPLEIVMNNREENPSFTIFFDGHVASRFDTNEIEIRIDDHVGDLPEAEVWFHGIGKRYGPLEMYGTSRVICTFRDKEQFAQYLTVIG